MHHVSTFCTLFSLRAVKNREGSHGERAQEEERLKGALRVKVIWKNKFPSMLKGTSDQYDGICFVLLVTTMASGIRCPSLFRVLTPFQNANTAGEGFKAIST